MACKEVAVASDISRILVREIRDGIRQEVELPLPDDLNEADVYPPVSSELSFTVEWDDTVVSKGRRCLVEFQNPPGPFHVAGIAARASMWGDILEAGGYAMPLGLPHEIESIAGSISQFDEYTVEVEVARFMASEAAWDILLNLLDSYSRSASRIVMVTVE
jgi:hypothetical protein